MKAIQMSGSFVHVSSEKRSLSLIRSSDTHHPDVPHPPCWRTDRQTDTDIRLSRSDPNLTRIEVFTVFNAQIISGCPHLKTPRRKKGPLITHSTRRHIWGPDCFCAPSKTCTHTLLFFCAISFSIMTELHKCSHCDVKHAPHPPLYIIFS